jgi:hypothetical protein|tara:strand:- start:118 stop:828 length:711 start_codon:yes stop_codon:yes gene_type:complete
MNIDFIKVPFSNNPTMQKFDGLLFNQNPNKEYLLDKEAQFKKYGADLHGQTKQFKNMNLNRKVTELLGLNQTDSFVETAMKIEEDIAVMHNGKLVAVCFCFPSGWIPGNELNSDLSKLHAPVADNELLIKSSKKLEQHMNKQTIRRWVWNVTTISNLSNHPNIERPKIIDFDSLYFRLETQVSTPLDDESSLFLVKVDVFPLKKVWNEKILESINSMSESVLKYKNLIEIKKFLNS